MLGSLSCRSSELQLFKIETQRQVFSVDIVKFLRTAFFCRKPPVTDSKVLPHYSKVSWAVCSLISRLHVLSSLIKHLLKTLHN